MAIRIRKVDGCLVALCAAETKPEPGDLYLDDGVHHVLSGKFYDDHVKMGFIKKPVVTEEFVEKWAIKLSGYYKPIDLILQMLKELSIKVKKKK